jgi:hypothetical protein
MEYEVEQRRISVFMRRILLIFRAAEGRDITRNDTDIGRMGCVGSRPRKNVGLSETMEDFWLRFEEEPRGGLTEVEVEGVRSGWTDCVVLT